MSNSTIILLIFIGIIAGLLVGIIAAITSKDEKRLQRSGSFASMAAFHDMQTAEKQKAMETVIEQKADKKLAEEESGEGEKKE